MCCCFVGLDGPDVIWMFNSRGVDGGSGMVILRSSSVLMQFI